MFNSAFCALYIEHQTSTMLHTSGEMLTQSSGQEPSMYLERPSSARSQDIRHILTKTFRELFTRDVVDPEKIRSLTVSKDNNDAYHKRYVTALQQVCCTCFLIAVSHFILSVTFTNVHIVCIYKARH